MKIHELQYSKTNTYLIEGDRGRLLFDTGWSGTYPDFCRAMGELGIAVQSIAFILISHFHPDHMGIAQEIADQGAVILVPEFQKEYVHASDGVFAKEKDTHFVPIDDERVRHISMEESRSVLAEIGIHGEILHTPGHSDDSISLFLDDGSLFVGDLNPLYELELHRGTKIGDSWEMLLSMKPRTVYYGHANKAYPDNKSAVASSLESREAAVSKTPADAGEKSAAAGQETAPAPCSNDISRLVSDIMKMTDKGYDRSRIERKTGADPEFIDDVMRMYLTHRDVGVQGILDRIEIKGR